jgi:hypothetical protein
MLETLHDEACQRGQTSAALIPVAEEEGLFVAYASGCVGAFSKTLSPSAGGYAPISGATREGFRG